MRLPPIPARWQLLSIGLSAVMTVVASDRWPHLSGAFSLGFGVVMVLLLCVDFMTAPSLQPVNYDALRISGDALEYTAFGETTVIRLADVSMLEFVREEAVFPDLYGPYIESTWRVWRGDGPAFEVMDEAPHRKQLLALFKARLPHFDDAAARAGLQASGEGRWLCYRAHDPHRVE